MKRLLLILAAIIGLVVAGGTLASNAPSARPISVQPGRANGGAPARHASVKGVALDRGAHPVKRRIDLCAAWRQPSSRAPALVTASGAYLLVDPPAAAPGGAVAMSGGGFSPGAALRLSVQAPGQTPRPLAMVKAWPDGSFCSTIMVPAAQAAPSAVLAARDAHGHQASATMVLRAVLPLAGIAPAVVSPGQPAAVWAANFRPGEQVRVFATRLGGPLLLTGVADRRGHAYWPLSVPYGSAGINQLVVLGETSHTPVVAHYLLLSLYPHAGVSNYAPQPGTRITFYGGGFGPHEPVELRLDRPDGAVLAVARTTAHGGLPHLGPYLVPFGLSAVRTFILHGRESHVTTTVPVRILPLVASVEPSTYAAGPGTVVTFYGRGFAPHEIVRVYLDRTAQNAGTEVAALHTTAWGQLIATSGSYAVPDTLHRSMLKFGLVGDISGAMATTTVHYMAPAAGVVIAPATTYQPPARQPAPPAEPRVPVLDATPPSAQPGGRVALAGTGFPSYAQVHLVLASNGSAQSWALGTAETGADGTLNATVTVPPEVTRADVVRAEVGTGGASSTARAELAVWPTVPHLTASAESGPAGAAYAVSGDGFISGEQVALYLDSIATPPLATAVSSGRVSFTDLRVPIAAAGAHTVVVKGTYGDIAAVSFTEWATTPFVLLSTYTSLPERPVVVSGKGFVPGETVHLLLGGTLVGTAQADDRGALGDGAGFTIAPSARGPLPVVAVGVLSGRPARTTLDVLPFEPSLWLSNYAGHPGATVAFTGTGFARNDVLDVYMGAATRPLATFQAHNGAFVGAGLVRIPFSTPAGRLALTVRGRVSAVGMTLRYDVVPFTPGAGYAVQRHGGVTVVRLGAGGFAPDETVRLYRGVRARGAPVRLLRADAAGNLPLLPVLSVRGSPTARLAYTLVGVQSGARATAVYIPHTTGRGLHTARRSPHTTGRGLHATGHSGSRPTPGTRGR